MSSLLTPSPIGLCFFFFNDTATTEIYTLSLHDALPISASALGDAAPRTVAGRFRAHDPTPGMGDAVARDDARAVCVARPSSPRPCHVAAATHGLGRLMVDFADDNLDEEFSLGDGTADTEGIVMCPYCGEPNEIGIDAGGGSVQDYVEDCQVCCRPWRVTVNYDEEGNAEISASPLDE